MHRNATATYCLLGGLAQVDYFYAHDLSGELTPVDYLQVSRRTIMICVNE